MEQNLSNLEITTTGFISSVVKTAHCDLYLELGVFQGKNIEETSKYSKRCIGVDVNDKLVFRDFEFHRKTTDEFFKDFNEKPDIIFIDADHNYNQVKKDFVNSLNCLNEGGIILLHDTDPISNTLLDQKYCGDSYKIHDWVKEQYIDLNIITLPISVAGITIINRESDRRVKKINE